MNMKHANDLNVEGNSQATNPPYLRSIKLEIFPINQLAQSRKTNFPIELCVLIALVAFMQGYHSNYVRDLSRLPKIKVVSNKFMFGSCMDMVLAFSS